MKVRILCMTLLLPVLMNAQTDEINISAAFTTSLSLRITGNANVEWVVATIDDYKEGFWPAERKVPFEVSASVNYSVEVSMNDLSDGAGNTLDIENVGFRIEGNGTDMHDRLGTSHVWTKGTGNLSGVYVASTTPQTLLTPGPDGNAGGYDQNQFKLRIGLASENIRNQSGLPSLLDQNITPGTYTSVVTLTAIPVYE